jgi:cytochrome P450
MIDGDLLSIILSDGLYQGDEEKTKDELTVLFMAGNETIKVSSTNTVCQLTRHPEAKRKFLEEISPVITRASNDLVNKLTIDDVD